MFPADEASPHGTERTGQGEECPELSVLCHFKLRGGAMMCKGLSPYPMLKMYIGWHCEGLGYVAITEKGHLSFREEVACQILMVPLASYARV